MSVLFYGDPHGEWRPLMRAGLEHRPDAVVILGDCDLDVPLRHKLAPLFAAGIRVRWIPGNHDTDQDRYYDNLWGDYPQGNLHAAYAQAGPYLVGGLGGVFKERIWYPRFDMAEPRHVNRRDYLKQLRRSDRWRGDLPLAVRDAIFPEDVKALKDLWLDILVTHEAPTCHRHGFVGIDAAAGACRAKLVIHGHHHQSYDRRLASGVPVRGLAKAEVFRLPDELPGWPEVT